MFKTKTRVSFSQNTANGRTVMELVAADRPGLLSKVGQIFVTQDLYIENAKIMTIGERAEDVFFISDDCGALLDDQAQQKLRDAIMQKLDHTHSNGDAK